MLLLESVLDVLTGKFPEGLTSNPLIIFGNALNGLSRCILLSFLFAKAIAFFESFTIDEDLGDKLPVLVFLILIYS